MSVQRPQDSPPISAPLRDVVTERLELRRFQHDDLDELAVVFSEPEVWRFPLGRGMTRDETAAFLERQIAHWARTYSNDGLTMNTIRASLRSAFPSRRRAAARSDPESRSE